MTFLFLGHYTYFFQVFKSSKNILIRIIIILKVLHFLMNYYLTTYKIIVLYKINEVVSCLDFSKVFMLPSLLLVYYFVYCFF